MKQTFVGITDVDVQSKRGLSLKKKYWRTLVLLWGHWYPCFGLLVTSPLGFKAIVGSLIHTWQRHTCYTFSETHLWCDTYWPPDSQHGSWAVLFHIPVNRHWWGWKLGSMVPLLPHSDAVTRQALYRLSYADSAETGPFFQKRSHLLGRHCRPWSWRIWSAWRRQPLRYSRILPSPCSLLLLSFWSCGCGWMLSLVNIFKFGLNTYFRDQYTQRRY